MKVVIDTNVMISALLWKGLTGRIIDLALQRKIKICVTPIILEEFFGVLSRRKFDKILQANNTTLLEIKDKVVQITQVYQHQIKLNIIKDDQSDNRFLECALASDAKYIVSGDQHLLKLKEIQNIPIISPRQFLKVLNNNDKI